MNPTISDDGDPPEERYLELAADKVAEQPLSRPARLVRATLVLPVRMTERPSVRPATANSVARVTTKEGSFVRTTRSPLTNPMTSPRASAATMPTMIGALVVARHDRDGHGARGEHRADGEIELPGNHQQPDRKRDDAEFGGDVEPARGPAGGEEVCAAKDGKEDEDGDQDR